MAIAGPSRPSHTRHHAEETIVWTMILILVGLASFAFTCLFRKIGG